jgi:S1-C subfamily serine protease
METRMSETASRTSLETLSAALTEGVADVASSIVAVHSHRSRSSGFVWRPGLIVTAEEALAEEGEIALVLEGGETVPATLVGRDPSTDIALLRISGVGLEPVALQSRPLAPGAITLAIGSQEGAPVVGLGVVSFAGPAWRSLRGGEIDARLELALSLLRHAQGGLAVDSSGHAFGMTVLGPRRRVLVIPAATIERVAAILETHGRIARGYLGLGLQPVRLEGNEGVGAMVMSVDKDGPGAAAGVRQGDVIAAWDGRPMRHVQSLLRALGPDSVRTIVTLALIRSGEPVEVRLTIGERQQT